MGTFNNEAIVQRGTITLTNVSSNYATLSTEIDTTTAELRFTGFNSSRDDITSSHPYLYLTSGTRVTATKYATPGSADQVIVGYEVTGVPV